jgi:predicted ester cyclase
VSADDDKAVVRRWIEAFNDRDEQAEADARAPGYVAHAPGIPGPLNSEAWKQFLAGFVDAFPDLRITIEDSVSEGGLVASRDSFRGTHRGEFQGLPPTNKQVAFTGIELNRIVNGKVEEHWVELDQLGLLQQLGLVVIPGPRLLVRMLGHKAQKLRAKRSAGG